MSDPLQEIDGVGPEVASSIREFFGGRGLSVVKALEAAGLNMTQPKRAVAAGAPLQGKTVVVTGTLEKFDRKGIEKRIKDLGGKASGSVSKKTDFLVAGESAGSKLDKAKELGVKIMSEAEFIEAFGAGG